MGSLIDIDIKIKDGKTALDVVSVQSLKEYIYEDRNRDSLIEELIKAAYEKLQRHCGMVFLRSEIKARYRNLDTYDLLLYTNGADNIVRSDSNVNGYYELGITEAAVTVGTRRKVNTITNVTYDAGYDIVPEWVKIAIKKQVAYDLEHLGDEQVNADLVSSEVKAYVKPFRRMMI